VDGVNQTEYLVRGRTWTKEYLQLDVGIDDDGYVVIVTVYPRQRKRGRRG